MTNKMSNEPYKIVANKVKQPIGEFFVAKISSKVLTECSSADIREYVDRFGTTIGIQRYQSKNRVKDISKYVQTVDASFPNSIILNLSEKMIFNTDFYKIDEIDEEFYVFHIQIDEKTFKIIDGQHRLAGLKRALDEGFTGDFDIIIAFYIDLPEHDQAYLFSTINSKQSNVNKSLLMDLAGLSPVHDPNRCAHMITKLLNNSEKSPMYQRIALLGRNPIFEGDKLYKTVLTQGTVASEFAKFISRNSIEDRDIIKRKEKLISSEENIDKGLIFRNFWIEGKDELILKVLGKYFNSISDTFSSEWNDEKNPLSRTVGFHALMLFLKDIFRKKYISGDTDFDYFRDLMNKIRQNYKNDDLNQITFDNFASNQAGAGKLHKKLLEWSELQD